MKIKVKPKIKKKQIHSNSKTAFTKNVLKRNKSLDVKT